MALVFFKIPKPRRFSYKPLYYDLAGEEQSAMKRSPSADNRERFRKEIRHRWKKKEIGQRKSRGNTALIIVMALIVTLLYFIFR